jgi:hypothetical protein
MSQNKKATAGQYTIRAYEQCAKMRKNIDEGLVPLMRQTVSALNNLNRSIEIVARELARLKESEDG